MDILQLENKLFAHTKSEKHYLTELTYISKRYNNILKSNINGEEIYLFTFNKFISQSKIYIHKESRFTHIPKHIHKVIEMNYVYSGECTQIINGKEIKLNEGDVCILDTNVPHEILPLSENDIVIDIVIEKSYFSAGFLSRLSHQGLLSNFIANAIRNDTEHNNYILFKNNNNLKFHRYIQDLMCEYFDKQICSNEIIDSYMVIIFSELVRILVDNKTHAHSKNNEILISVLQYLELNYKTCTLKSTAEYFNFHPNYLSSYLKKHTGMNFKDLLITQRITEASFYLKNSELPIYEIVSQIGYDNLGFFYKKFKEIFDMTPLEYRNSYYTR